MNILNCVKISADSCFFFKHSLGLFLQFSLKYLNYFCVFEDILNSCFYSVDILLDVWDKINRDSAQSIKILSFSQFHVPMGVLLKISKCILWMDKAIYLVDKYCKKHRRALFVQRFWVLNWRDRYNSPTGRNLANACLAWSFPSPTVFGFPVMGEWGGWTGGNSPWRWRHESSLSWSHTSTAKRWKL